MRATGVLVLAVVALLAPGAAWAEDVTFVRDVNPGAPASEIREIQPIGGTIFFWATDPANGKELWKSNGTSAGTVLVKDIRPGAASAYPGGALAYMAVMGGTLYFAANDGIRGNELWKSDGTSAGTVLVRDIHPGSLSSDPGAAPGGDGNPGRLIAIGSRLYFPATNTGSGTELWSSDGSAVGTALLKDVNAGTASSRPQLLTAVGSRLFFRAATATAGAELHASDGTATGTTLIRDINLGANSSSPAWLTNVAGMLFFSAFSPAGGYELWRSNGTLASTGPVRAINPGTASAVPQLLTARGSTVFFTANDGTHGGELWKSEGTAASTLLVRDINPGGGSSDPYNLTAVGDVLYFSASEPATGAELWRSDGSEAATVRLSDIKPGAAGAFPNSVTALRGNVYFTAFDASLGKELYALRPSGPVLIRDLWPGLPSSSPYGLTALTPSPITPRLDKLLFVADDGVHGWELWKLTQSMVIGP